MGTGPRRISGELEELLVRIGEQVRTEKAPTAAAESVALSLTHEPARERQLPSPGPEIEPVRAIIEHNLGRKAIFSTQPDRGQQVFRYTTEDVVGTLTVEYTLGQLGRFEMQLVMWALGRWSAHTDTIVFSQRECARDFQVEWGGKFSRQLKESLRRIDRTRFTGTVYHRASGKHVTKHFGIFSEIQIVERRATENGPALEPGTVQLKISPFFDEQLRERQYSLIDWETVRFTLKTTLAQRLYVFVEGQKGFAWRLGDATHTEYVVGIDSRLVATLGSSDTNPRRFRERLRDAGREITAADPKYIEIAVIAGRNRTSPYRLRVRRYGAPAKALRVAAATVG